MTFFGSARTLPDDPLYLQARRLAERMAHHGWMVVTGAGPGIMAAAMEGAGRELSIGVNIRLPHEQGANAFIAQDPKLVEMRYFFTRKLMLIKESDGYAVLPGGFGTLDEAFELLTLLQTGKAQPAPLVLLDVPGGTYWDGWRSSSTPRSPRGGSSPRGPALFKITSDVDEAADELLGFYRNYHSCRWVGDLLVMRLRTLPPGPSCTSSPRRSPTSSRAAPSGPPNPSDRSARAATTRPAPGGASVRPHPLRAAAPAHRRPERTLRSPFGEPACAGPYEMPLAASADSRMPAISCSPLAFGCTAMPPLVAMTGLIHWFDPEAHDPCPTNPFKVSTSTSNFMSE